MSFARFAKKATIEAGNPESLGPEPASNTPAQPHTGSSVSPIAASWASGRTAHAESAGDQATRRIPAGGFQRSNGGGEKGVQRSFTGKLLAAAKKATADTVESAPADQDTAGPNILHAGSTRVVLKMKSKAKQVKAKSALFLHPNSHVKHIWDGVMATITFYSVCEIPFRVSFIPLNRQPLEWKVFNWLVDFLFFVDICLSFCTAYHTEDGLVTNPKKIAVKYALSGFLPDLVATLSGLAELIDTRSKFKSVQELDSVRLLRLIKLMQFIAFKTSKSNLLRDNVNPAVLKLAQLLGTIVFTAHLIACFWFKVNECEETQLGGSCPPGVDQSACWSKCGGESILSQYLASIYWTIATMMAVGYGDVYAVSPPERMYAVFTQLVGAISFGFIIATVTSIIETLDPRGSAKKERLEEILRYAAERQLPLDLQRRIRRHVNYYYSSVSVFPERFILDGLSDHILWKVIFFTRGSFLLKLSFTRRVDVRFVIALSQSMHPFRFQRNAVIAEEGNVSEEVYFLQSGTVYAQSGVADDRVLVGVCSSGDDFELDSALNRSQVAVTYTAVSNGEGLWLPQGDLWSVVLQHTDSVDALVEECEEYRGRLSEVMSSKSVHRGGMKCKELILVGSHRMMPLARVHQLLPTLLDGGEVRMNGTEHLIHTCRMRAPGGGSWLRKSPSSTAQRSEPSYIRWMTAFCGSVSTRGNVVEGKERSQALWGRLIVDPTHDSKIFWDVFVGVATVASVVLVPLDMGLELKHGAWAVIDHIFTACFVADMLVNFRTAFLNENGVYDTIPQHIACHYTKGWFFVDFFSTFPFEILFQGTPAARLTKMIRLFRVLKLFRLLKLKRLSLPEIVQELDITVQKGVKLFFTLFFIAHFFGCFWNYISIAGPAREDSRTWWGADGLESDDRLARYVGGVYWAITTMTTVGYGDILPQNDLEKLYATVIMLMGATVFGYIVGSVSTLASDPQSVYAQTNLRLTQISNYLKEQSVDKDVRSRVRRAMCYVFQRRTPFKESKLLSILPQALRQEIIIKSNQDIIGVVPFFRHQSDSTVAFLLRHMNPYSFDDGENVFDWRHGADGLYTLVEGMLERIEDLTPSIGPALSKRASVTELRMHVYVMRAGSFFGHECMIGRAEPEYTYLVAKGACRAHVLLASAVAELIEMQPDLMKKFRSGLFLAASDQDAFYSKQRAEYQNLRSDYLRTLREQLRNS